jgi:hypothetical protein
MNGLSRILKQNQEQPYKAREVKSLLSLTGSTQTNFRNKAGLSGLERGPKRFAI